MSARLRPLKRYTSLAVLIDLLANRHLALIRPSLWADRNDQFLIEEYRRRAGFAFLGAACFTEASETFHHWKIFADGMAGVCIEFHKDRLEQCLAADQSVRLRQVDYVKLDGIEDTARFPLDDLPFYKRAGYSDEREYRVIHCSQVEGVNAIHLPIDLACVGRVILSPFLPMPMKDAIRATLRGISGCEKLLVVKSHLVDSTSWTRKWNKRLGHEGTSE